ncbi:carbohydrate ABC transporter permease [Gracilibacillus phocaeensis]|uniref:carbohydrate ABC transporter permease n=1 Tax=Gracilibacillus phocaeensis TaxID=2042304 RepID=UPI002570F92E|nr:carbohydrate ABC transporter permease [Gracilibacillus phocaeensis]
MIIQVYPIVWIFLSSLKNETEIQNGNPFTLPEDFFNFNNYIQVWETSQIGTYFINSSIVTVITIILIVLLSSSAGFAIEKMKFKSSNLLLLFFLFGIMIPVQATLIPLFTLYNTLGLLNTHISLILPQVGFALPISIYLFVGFYKYIPNEMIEAATIDGCNIYTIFRKIILPLSKNTIVTVVAFNSIFIWNEFVFAHTFINEATMKTLPVGLQDFIGQYGATDWGSTFASMVIATLPVLIIYFILNRSVIEGMALGSTKG